MAKGLKDRFVSVPLCTETDRATHVSDLRFEAKVDGAATPRFMVNFEGAGANPYGATSTDKLPAVFEEIDGASGDVLPCDQIENMVEIAFILDRDEAVGVYADGFDMTYTAGGETYTTHASQRFGICASQGPNPEPIAEGCKRMEKW